MRNLKWAPLIPFGNKDPKKKPEIKVKAMASLSAGILSVEFACGGRLEQVVFPASQESNSRCNNLWKHTCFEVFFKKKGDSNYWELNLSTRGEWNLYRFDSYRAGMREELLIAHLNEKYIHLSHDSAKVSLKIDLSPFLNFLENEKISIGIAAVIEKIDTSLEYWALKHCSSLPDFHQPESFTLDL